MNAAQVAKLTREGLPTVIVHNDFYPQAGGAFLSLEFYNSIQCQATTLKNILDWTYLPFIKEGKALKVIVLASAINIGKERTLSRVVGKNLEQGQQ